ncbi:hypothetical protein GCM10007384_20450 [Aquimarina muelleri]|uniref:Uncharacterized protein n=2 Tax=Aquimarina muelleri TaxID=279356 RepID=A0A918JVK8_9FLAO|nr:hypothetical protein GCM10007384_20450 [Aquimarina muelleri]
MFLKVDLSDFNDFIMNAHKDLSFISFNFEIEPMMVSYFAYRKNEINVFLIP